MLPLPLCPNFRFIFTACQGRYDVTVEPSGAFQKDLAPEKVGRILL